jgi:ferrous iron transport protein B
MKLSELKVGEKGYIVKVLGYGGFRKRIVEMGFIKGKEVEVLQSAPLQDPVKYRIMGYEVSCRRSVAAQIEVIKEAEAQKFLANTLNDFNGTFSEDDFRHVALEKRREINIALVGNPNSGKSTIFNAATGEHAKVGNYAGVTVETKKGTFTYKNYKFTMVDLPGTYSISAFSPEERLVREYIVKEKPDVIINVLDANNLERNMFLTTQLIDMNVRTVIAMNFYDELKNRGDKIDYDALGKLIGIPFVPTVGTKKVGLDNLFDTIIKLYEGSEIIDKEGKLIEAIENDELIERYHHLVELEHRHRNKNEASDFVGIQHVHEIVRHVHINYGKTIEKAITKIKEEFIKNESIYDDFTPRYIAIQLLEHDKEIEGFAARFRNYFDIIKIRDFFDKKIEEELNISAANAITDAKYGFIAGALKETFFPSKQKRGKTATEKIDNIVTNKYLAYPIFILIILVMFGLTFGLGEYPKKGIEFLIEKSGNFIENTLPNGILSSLLREGIIGGAGAVLTFLPLILILYFCISLLETSGYMARAAFITDRFMHKIGLHGRSFIPLMMGFGCNVPAIMATRTIENRNSRMITIIISSLIPCATRMSIFVMIVGIIFNGKNDFIPKTLALFGIYFTGIFLVAVLSKIFKKFIFNREETPFVMELPAYRAPTFKHIARETWEKCAQYLKKISTTVLAGTVIIWALNYFPLQHSENGQKSCLEQIGTSIAPVMKPLGFDWDISAALLSGVIAKELFISTWGIINTVDGDAYEDKNATEELQQKIRSRTRPDGTSFFSTATMISLLLFVLIYFPCIATIAVVKQETGRWRWAVFVAVYTILLAWIASFAAYNIISAQFYQETATALIILISLFLLAKKIIIKKQFPKKCAGC